MEIWIDILTLAVLMGIGVLMVAFTAPMISKTLRRVPAENWANLTIQTNEAIRPTPELARKNDFDFAGKIEIPLPRVPGARHEKLFHDDPLIQLRAFLDNYKQSPDDFNRVLLVEAINQVIGQEKIAPEAAKLAESAISVIHEIGLGEAGKRAPEGGVR